MLGCIKDLEYLNVCNLTNTKCKPKSFYNNIISDLRVDLKIKKVYFLNLNKLK